MDDDSPDERAGRSPRPDGPLPLGAAARARDAGAGGDETGSEGSSGSDGDEDEDEEGSSLGGESGSADSAEEGGAQGPPEEEEEEEEEDALSSDEAAESCPICLNAFRGQALGTPEACAHHFCLDCLLEWAKNANSCPVDRTLFRCVCIRARFGGQVLRKVPVERAAAREEEEEDDDDDPTFCERCGRSDREDRLLLCDGCDAGYHMECLRPPLQEVPVDEWFCPECAAPGEAAAAGAGPAGREASSLLPPGGEPPGSRPHPRATRAIARTRQSERVRASVNRNRLSTARRMQHVPRHLASSLLDEAIEAVASGLSTAVYRRPLAPRAPARQRRKAGRRRKASGRRKAASRAAGRGRGARAARRTGRLPRRKAGATQSEASARSRLSRTLGLRRPPRAACAPSARLPADAFAGATPLSVFGDPHELDPFDSEDPPASPTGSPASSARRPLSQSALRSHRPVARPVSVGLSRSSLPAAGPESELREAPVPDLLGSILSGQSLLLLSGADVTIHRDGSLSAKRAAPVSSPRSAAAPSRPGPGPGDGPPPGGPHPGPGRDSLGSGTGPPRAGPTRRAQDVSGPSFLRGEAARPPPLGPGPAPKPAPPGPEAARPPQAPTMGGGRPGGSAPARGQPVEPPGACISRLTGREGPAQPGRQGPREPGPQPGGAPAPRTPCPAKAAGSTFQSFRINIPGSAAPAGRPARPGFRSTFRPVGRAAAAAPPSPGKAQRLESEMYDPFDPTGSDSSSPAGSPERLGPGPPPAGLTRTISLRGPEAPAAPAVRCVTSYTVDAALAPEPCGRPPPGDDGDPGRGPPGDEDAAPRGRCVSPKERTVACAPDPGPEPLACTPPRVVELRPRSPASPRAQKQARRKRGRSRSRSRSRASRSASPPGPEEPAGRHRPRARGHRSSSDGSSGHERARRRRARGRSREDRRAPGGCGPGRRRSRSGSPGREGRAGKRRPHLRDGPAPGSPARPRSRRSHHHSREPSRSRSRERPRGRRRHRSRSPGTEHRARPPRRLRSPARRPTREAPAPPAREEPAAPGQPAVSGAGPAPQGPQASRALPGAPAEDLDYGDAAEAGHVFEDLAGTALLAQLDDMSSPPSPSPSGSSSPERPRPGPPEAPRLRLGGAEATLDVARLPKEAGPPQTPLQRAKALVKRVTWNLQAAGDASLRPPLHRPLKPQEGAWGAEEERPPRTPPSEPPPSGHLLPEPSFPRASATQGHCLDLPPAPALPSCAPAGQPASQLLQGGLPSVACGPAQSPAPVPSVPATASEPAGHTTTSSEQRTAVPRPGADRTKTEEYMKKLHVQERAVEEVKLAIKPFYQRREVTKEEYKDILRKAVQKICHSKSGEINPVKVGNLVKAYVDKYRHMRRQRRAEAAEGPGAQG